MKWFCTKVVVVVYFIISVNGLCIVVAYRSVL